MYFTNYVSYDALISKYKHVCIIYIGLTM